MEDDGTKKKYAQNALHGSNDLVDCQGIMNVHILAKNKHCPTQNKNTSPQDQ
jgi:hypothetical protein